MKNIILFGTIGAGKDTVKEYLMSLGYSELKLGYYIRKHVDEMFSELDPSQRRTYYQSYGEGMREIFGEDFWNLMAQKRESVLDGPFIVSDARQPHELTFWLNKGYVPVAIHCDEDIRMERLKKRDQDNFNPAVFTHPTEFRALSIITRIKDKSLNGFLIDNSHTKESTLQQVKDILTQLQ